VRADRRSLFVGVSAGSSAVGALSPAEGMRRLGMDDGIIEYALSMGVCADAM
jgi:hypothetical protein